MAVNAAAAYEQRRAMNEYLESLTLDELKALEAAIIWKEADPHRNQELSNFSPNELIALYQKQLQKTDGSGGDISPVGAAVATR